MFDLRLADEQEAVIDVATSLGTDVLYPAAREAEQQQAVPPKVWRAMSGSGLAIPVRERYGDGGIPDAVTHCLAQEALGHGDPGIALAAMWTGAAAVLMGMCAEDDPTARCLPDFATDADLRAGVALYEGLAGRPASSPRRSGTRAMGSTGCEAPKSVWPLRRRPGSSRSSAATHPAAGCWLAPSIPA